MMLTDMCCRTTRVTADADSETMTIVWQSCPFRFLMELSVQHCCCCLTIRGSTHPLPSTSSLHLSREVVGSGPWPPWTPRSIRADETQIYPAECVKRFIWHSSHWPPWDQPHC